MADHKLQVIPLGGLGEFGMNCMAIRYGDDIIVVDAGMMFPEAELLGVDIVTPDFTFLEQNAAHVRGLVLTHGHEDHIGGVPFLLAAVQRPGLRHRLHAGAGRAAPGRVRDARRGQASRRSSRATIVEIGPFKIEFIHVTHSIVSCVALAITTPLGVIIHTGDFKVDPTPTDNELFDLHTLADYGKRGVLLLLSDSTNVGPPRLYRIRARRAARAWKTCSTARRAAWWFPASAPRFTACSRFSICRAGIRPQSRAFWAAA